MTTKKTLPCSLYDIQGLQNWLDEMALQGLFFRRFSGFSYSAEFEEGAPRPVRYRLDPAGQSEEAGRAVNWDRFRTIYFCVFVPLLFVLIFSIPAYAPEHSGPDEVQLSHTWPTLFQIEALEPHPLKEEPVVDGYVRQNRSRLVPVQERITVNWEVTTFDPATGELSTFDRPYRLWLSIQYDRARSLWAARQTFLIRRDDAAQDLEDARSPSYLYPVTDLRPFETLEYPGLDRLELVRFRQYEQDCWLFTALRGEEVLTVHYIGNTSPWDCLPLFLAALDSHT